jgi:outer membrane protein OmpA-like peptidoglycan-associated protein
MTHGRIFSTAVLLLAGTFIGATGPAATPSYAQTERNTLDATDHEVSAAEIANALTPKTLRSLGPAPMKENTAIVALTFDTGSVGLTAQSKAMLREFGTAFKDYMPGVAVIIEGHCDPRGGEQYNLELSRRRAAAVRDYLVAELGNDPKQFAVVGFGATRLMDPKNPTAKVNRRVEFVTKNIP